jgi:hypothetical protein
MTPLEPTLRDEAPPGEAAVGVGLAVGLAVSVGSAVSVGLDVGLELGGRVVDAVGDTEPLGAALLVHSAASGRSWTPCPPQRAWAKSIVPV